MAVLACLAAFPSFLPGQIYDDSLVPPLQALEPGQFGMVTSIYAADSIVSHHTPGMLRSLFGFFGGVLASAHANLGLPHGFNVSLAIGGQYRVIALGGTWQQGITLSETTALVPFVRTQLGYRALLTLPDDARPTGLLAAGMGFQWYGVLSGALAWMVQLGSHPERNALTTQDWVTTGPVISIGQEAAPKLVARFELGIPLGYRRGLLPMLLALGWREPQGAVVLQIGTRREPMLVDAFAGRFPFNESVRGASELQRIAYDLHVSLVLQLFLTKVGPT